MINNTMQKVTFFKVFADNKEKMQDPHSPTIPQKALSLVLQIFL